jgi:hypothetical protein
MDRDTGFRLDKIFSERVSPIAEQLQDRVWRAKLSEPMGKHRVPRANYGRPPTAVCMSCGHLGYRNELVGTLCRKRKKKTTCGGFVARAQALGKWQRCPSCLHAGFKKAINCAECGDKRWLFVGCA